MPDNFDVELARLDERVKMLTSAAEGVQFVAGQVNRLAERMDAQADGLDELKHDLAATEGRMEKAVGRVEKSCNDLGDLIRNFSAARQTGRATIIVGLIGFAGVIVTALLPRLL